MPASDARQMPRPRPRVIVVLLLGQEGLVRTVRFRQDLYIGDPINAVRIFNEKGADELVLLDIDATVCGRSPRLDILQRLAGEAFMPLAYGGGIGSVSDARGVLRLGFEKVVVNTALDCQRSLITDMSQEFGRQSVVVSIDVRRTLLGGHRAYVYGGRRRMGMPPAELAEVAQALGAGEVLLSSIDRNGTFSGYDTAAIRSVAHRIGIPLIACGGAGRVADFAAAIESGAAAVAAGSLFVVRPPHRAVLLTYPTEREIDQAFA